MLNFFSMKYSFNLTSNNNGEEIYHSVYIVDHYHFTHNLYLLYVEINLINVSSVYIPFFW